MAVEITPAIRTKRLHRHAAPIIMLAITLLALSASIVGSYKSTGLNSVSVVSRGLVTQVLHVRPTPNGLAEVTINDPPSSTNAGYDLQTGLAQAGSTVQLLLNLQTPVGKQ